MGMGFARDRPRNSSALGNRAYDPRSNRLAARVDRDVRHYPDTSLWQLSITMFVLAKPRRGCETHHAGADPLHVPERVLGKAMEHGLSPVGARSGVSATAPGVGSECNRVPGFCRVRSDS